MKVSSGSVCISELRRTGFGKVKINTAEYILYSGSED